MSDAVTEQTPAEVLEVLSKHAADVNEYFRLAAQALAAVDTATAFRRARPEIDKALRKVGHHG
jgi:predicted hydrolase (HD superfamily)